jgi:small-conductance mechanosensitive channel
MDTVVVASLVGLPTWLQIVTLLSLSFVAAKGIELLGALLVQQSQWLTNREYNRILVEELHMPLYVTVFLVGVYTSAQLIPQFGLGFYIAAVAMTIILLVWSTATIRLGNRVIGAANSRPSGRNITPIFKNLLTFFVVLATLFILLSIWSVDITPLLASAGVIGIVLGIAARDSLGNFFSGISLYLDKTYKVGDMIELESGERGTVLDMSIRSTTLLTLDNVAVTVPNAELNSTQIINESAPRRRRRIRLDVGVAYGSNLETVEEALLAVAADTELVRETPSPAVRFREFGDSAIVVQLHTHIDHPALRGKTRHQLIRGINEQFKRDGIEVPFPQRELSFSDSNTINIDETRSEDLPPENDRSVDR